MNYRIYTWIHVFHLQQLCSCSLFLLLLCNIPWHSSIIFCLFILLLVDIWDIFSFIMSNAVGSLKILFVYFMYFLAVLGLGFWVRAYSSFGKRELLFVAVLRPLIVVASPLWNTGSRRVGSVAVACATTLVAPQMWDLSGPGIEPMSSVLTSRFLTTGPWGRSLCCWFFKCGPQTSSISITGSLLELQILKPHPRPLEQETLGRGPAICV